MSLHLQYLAPLETADPGLFRDLRNTAHFLSLYVTTSCHAYVLKANENGNLARVTAYFDSQFLSQFMAVCDIDVQKHNCIRSAPSHNHRDGLSLAGQRGEQGSHILDFEFPYSVEHHYVAC